MRQSSRWTAPRWLVAGIGLALALGQGSAGAQDDDAPDSLPGYPRELGRPTGRLLQELRTVPPDVPWEMWLGTAKRLGVPLLEAPEDLAEGESARAMVEGFRFVPGDYPALEGFTPVRADKIAIGDGFVNQLTVLRKGDGPELRITTEVGQATPVALRHAFLHGLLRPDTSGGSYPPPATDEGVTVGDGATASAASLSGATYVAFVAFYRRTVWVALDQDGPALNLGALAVAIDTMIKQRPWVPTLASSRLRPKVAAFTLENGSAQAGERIRGRAEWEDPSGQALVATVDATTGTAALAGELVTYWGRLPGRDTVSIRVANSLNLSDQKDLVIVIR